MNKITVWRILLLVLFVFSVYHLVRDVLQIANVHTAVFDLFHRHHRWCGSICNYVTLPTDVIGVLLPLAAHKKPQAWSVIVLSLLVAYWPIGQLLP